MIDLLIVLAFVAWSVGAGLRARRRASSGLDQYFLAGRTLPGWKAGTSMAATQFAADTPLLVTGLIATGGVFLLWRLWIYGLAFLLMAFLFARFWRRAGVLTDAELVEMRYSGRGVLVLRALKAVYYGTVINCVVMAMVLVAAVRIAEAFLPWHAWLPPLLFDPVVQAVESSGLAIAQSATRLDPLVATADATVSVALILAFVGLYSTTGGLRGVVATDVVQFAIAMIATLIYAVVVIAEVGGLGALPARVAEIYGREEAATMLGFAPPADAVLAPLLVVVGLQWLFQMNSDGTGYLAQRSLACRTDADARVAGVVFAWAQVLVRSLIWLVIGAGLLVLYPYAPADAQAPGFAAAREFTFVRGVEDLLPAGVRGLMLTGLLAALASTLDTHLNWGASYWANDLYGRIVCRAWRGREPSGRELVSVARLSAAIIVALALVVMANLGSIQQAWFVSLLFGAGTGAVLVLRWLWERVNLEAELAALATGLVLAPALLAATDAEWVRIGGMAIVSTAVVVGVSLLTPPSAEETRIAFYRRVRPAGLWRETARAAGEDPSLPMNRLRRGLADAGACSASLFLLLYGIGALLVPAPGSSPWWPGLAVAVGLALVPIWWRAVRGG